MPLTSLVPSIKSFCIYLLMGTILFFLLNSLSRDFENHKKRELIGNLIGASFSAEPEVLETELSEYCITSDDLRQTTSDDVYIIGVIKISNLRESVVANAKITYSSSDAYYDFSRDLTQILKSDGRYVLALPIYRVRSQQSSKFASVCLTFSALVKIERIVSIDSIEYKGNMYFVNYQKV